MGEFFGFGKLLMVAGGVLFLVGLAVFLGPRIPFLGRLPGDLHVQWKGGGFYFPVVTCVVISVLLTLVLNLISRK